MKMKTTLETINEEIRLMKKYGGKNIHAWNLGQTRIGFNLPEFQSE